MLSNAYFVAKFRFDTAENEPAKNLQNLANFLNSGLRYDDGRSQHDAPICEHWRPPRAGCGLDSGHNDGSRYPCFYAG